MLNYNEIYSLYEDFADLHPSIPEKDAAENAVDTALHTLDAETMFKIDDLIGVLVRAYEMQGFLFGVNYARTH